MASKIPLADAYHLPLLHALTLSPVIATINGMVAYPATKQLARLMGRDDLWALRLATWPAVFTCWCFGFATSIALNRAGEDVFEGYRPRNRRLPYNRRSLTTLIRELETATEKPEVRAVVEATFIQPAEKVE